MQHLDLLTRLGRVIDWPAWDQLIASQGITIDRPRRSRHPTFPDIVYPIDYGYINGTIGTDGEEIDIFVGSAHTPLVAVLLTADFRKGDREAKLLYGCTPEEIYLVHGFINYDPSKMRGTLIMRRPMHELWENLP